MGVSLSVGSKAKKKHNANHNANHDANHNLDQNSQPKIVWSGGTNYGRKHGYGTESEIGTNLVAYGAYDCNIRVGIWEFKEGSTLLSIHKYHSNGWLEQVVQYQNGVPKIVYPLNNNPTEKLPDVPNSIPDEEPPVPETK